MAIYTICLVVGLVYALFSAFAGHFFGGHDMHSDVGTGGHAESGFDHSGVPGISFFSPTVLASFITAFGAFGTIFSKIDATKSPWISAPLSVLGAAAVAMVVLTLVNFMFSRTQSSSESRVGSLVGMEATVITPVPENGVGEVAYVQGGTRYTAPARSEGGSPITGGAVVTIVRVSGPQFVVKIKA